MKTFLVFILLNLLFINFVGAERTQPPRLQRIDKVDDYKNFPAITSFYKFSSPLKYKFMFEDNKIWLVTDEGNKAVLKSRRETISYSSPIRIVENTCSPEKLTADVTFQEKIIELYFEWAHHSDTQKIGKVLTTKGSYTPDGNKLVVTESHYSLKNKGPYIQKIVGPVAPLIMSFNSTEWTNSYRDKNKLLFEEMSSESNEMNFEIEQNLDQVITVIFDVKSTIHKNKIIINDFFSFGPHEVSFGLRGGFSLRNKANQFCQIAYELAPENINEQKQSQVVKEFFEASLDQTFLALSLLSKKAEKVNFYNSYPNNVQNSQITERTDLLAIMFGFASGNPSLKVNNNIDIHDFYNPGIE